VRRTQPDADGGQTCQGTTEMRPNNAAQPDARTSAKLCDGHAARAGGCER
jgi:hypothetical protein